VYINAPRGVRPSAAALAALSVLATGGAVVATPGIAYASVADTIQNGQSTVVQTAVVSPVLVGPVLPATTGPARGTRTTLAADTATILTGQSIVFTGTLTLGKRGTPLTNYSVRLQSSTGGKWKTVAHALASDDGSVTFAVKPSDSAKYRLAYAGVQTLRASVSPEQAITVKQPPPPPPPPRPVTPPAASSASWAPAGVSSIGANGVAGSPTGQAIVDAAAAQSGKAYVYAAAGPDSFDCSGLTQYVFAQFGIALPHNAHAQLGYGSAVSAADAAPGDLIFFLDGGYAYHVGIYAGGNQMYDAPNSGSTVGLHSIWSTNVAFRRLV
jgi:cell wall-associated NlpC family hydrolase